MFRFTQKQSSESSPVLCKNYQYGLSVLVGIDEVNVMAAYRPVMQACGSRTPEQQAFVGSLYKSDLIIRFSCRNFKVIFTTDLYSVLANNQLDALFHVFIYLFHLSTFFEHHSAHHQEIEFY